MNTSIEISGLKLYGYHGVAPQERRVGNTFVYDVSINYDWLPGAFNDDIERTISYADVVEIIKQINDQPSNLLENVAIRLRNALLTAYPDIRGGKVRVAKPTPPIPSTQADSIAVVLSW